MQKLKTSKQSHAKRASFSNNTRIDRIVALQLNKRTNTRLRCESLNKVKTLDKAALNEKPKWLQKV